MKWFGHIGRYDFGFELCRASDGKWERDGKVRRLAFPLIKYPNGFIQGVIVGPWCLNIGLYIGDKR